MIKKSATLSLRIDLADLEDLERNVKPNGKFHSVSECIRELAKIGNKVMEYQSMMKDPAKASEFQDKMHEMLQTEKMDEWSQTLTTEQLDGFLMFLQMEKDKRFEQKTFR